MLLLWWMRGRVCAERLPTRQVVVEFDFRNAQPRRMWLVLKREDVSVCLTHPGFEPTVWVEGELSVLYQVWLGRISFREAEEDELIRLDAEGELKQAFPGWFTLSPVAEIVRDAGRA